VRRINISIDDITPHPRSSIRVVENCLRIISRVPSAKFTLFVPTAYWRTVPAPPESICSVPYYLPNFPDFCQQLMSLPDDSFEIGFHGHHHGIPGKSNNDELKSVSFDEAREIYGKMFNAVQEAGLGSKFKMMLRPPAWRLSADAFDAARGVFDLLALNPDPMYHEVYGGKQHDSHWRVRTVFADAYPPILPVPEKWERLELVFHACEWDKNYLTPALADSVIDLFQAADAEGAFIGDLIG
jgi:hypothetical protein